MQVIEMPKKTTDKNNPYAVASEVLRGKIFREIDKAGSIPRLLRQLYGRDSTLQEQKNFRQKIVRCVFPAEVLAEFVDLFGWHELTARDLLFDLSDVEYYDDRPKKGQ